MTSFAVGRAGGAPIKIVGHAVTLRERMLGLLTRPPLGEREALVITPASQVHTFGMRYSLDVIFCDREWRVLYVGRSVRPQRVTRYVRGSHHVLELRAGNASDIAAGDQLSLRDL